MREQEIIERTKAPFTVDSLVNDLTALGVEPGSVLLVHSSLSSIGWVCGGPVALIIALETVLRSYGTLVMPTHTGHLSDPSGWENPPVPEPWWETIRQSMPAFDPDLTPSRGMGAVPECFRKQREVMRSTHPHVSFAAWGEEAIGILSGHKLDDGLGEASPLARIYELDGWVLLLGVGHDRNTSFHLAEYRADYGKKQRVACSAPVLVEGHRRWRRYDDINYDASDFHDLGRDFERHWGNEIRSATVGNASCRLFRQRLCVDFAETWLPKHRR
jgi:aminoglycoside 3-N-acetyltransferase